MTNDMHEPCGCGGQCECQPDDAGLIKIDAISDERTRSEDAEFEAILEEQFPREAAIYKQSGMDRRSFMKVMGASLALAGLTLEGCGNVQPPGEEIIPYVRVPEEVIPGRPVFFASAATLGGYATGLLIETHEGRPTRVEGNPEHPASLGGSDVMTQASILELYNPERSIYIREDGEIATWEDFLLALDGVQLGDGTGVRILTETVTSPTLAAQLEALLEMYPNAKWYQYEPIARDNVYEGAMMAFGEAVNTVYRFDQANVVLSLDANFLSSMPGSVRYAHDFMSGRKVREDNAEMNRLYVVESAPSNAGAMADHRLALRASEVVTFAQALAAALGVEGVSAPGSVPWDEAWFDTLVSDLQENSGASVVVPSDQQSPVVHALAHAINEALGNTGSTVVYTPPVVANPANQGEQLDELVEEMMNGNVSTLLMVGGNPVFNAPADVPFVDGLENVAFKVHLSLYNDETSQLCDWHIPQKHYIEQWGDALAYDGTASITQPPIGPLYDTVRSPYEMLALLLEDTRSEYDIVRENWAEQYGGDDFETFWQGALHAGVVEGSAPEPISPTVSADFSEMPEATAGGLELIFRPDPAIWDGRFAQNAWLQELPDPLTKVTWDNVALVSPATADRLGIRTEDLVELSYSGNTMRVPVWTLPGHPDDAVTIALGYGRGLSADLDAGENFNAYQLRTTETPWFGGGLSVSRVGRYELATTRNDVQVTELDPVRTGTIDIFRENPDFVHEGESYGDYSLLPEYDYSEGNQWGMSIDLTACIGCNACMVACQMENNIPTVGKKEVTRGRDMYWIRVDRYYAEDGDEQQTQFQPVPCMHCEKAPCEIVCPVQATVHDHEGLNNMIYNRCIGTRYCSANCPYGVRRFNFDDYTDDAAILQEYRNPDVTVRVQGVMEKCTYCIQRIKTARVQANIENRDVRDGEVVPACASACPTNAIVFGNINDPDASVTNLKAQPHDYSLLGELNTQPRTTYLARLSNPNSALSGSEEEE